MKILVTGKDGLVGNALYQQSKNSKHEFVFVGRKNADLTNAEHVDNMFNIHNPNYVIHTAAFVGGLGGNLKYPEDMFYKNILMNSHVIHSATKYNVKKLLAFSSVCVFPDNLPILRETEMHSGDPYPSQRYYACAKRAIDIQIEACKKQYGIDNYSSLILTNIFGENDCYNTVSGHVIPSLIHKLYLAKKENKPLCCWGDGSSKREFIYSHDLAKIILKIIELDKIPERIIISRNEEVSIKEIVEKLCKIADFKGEVIWETDKPNGQKARPTDLTVLKSLIEPEYTDFDIALDNSYNWFAQNYPKVRM